MKPIYIDGVRYEVPDDATLEEIDEATRDPHSQIQQVGHIMAKGLPLAGGIAGGIAGGGMGAVAGAPSGPGAVLTGAAGAGLGAGLLSSAGRAAQHFVDERLGYEQPGNFTEKLKDVAATGAKDAAYTAAGGLALGAAAEGARMLPGALDDLGTRLGRRVLTGGTHQLGVRKPLSAEEIGEAFRQGAYRPGGTTQSAADALAEAEARVGAEKGAILPSLQESGVTGSNRLRLMMKLFRDAKAKEATSILSPEPEMFRSAARDLMTKPVDAQGNLDLVAQEEMKKGLQFDASKEYDKISRQYTPAGEAKKALASRLRQSVEDSVASQAAKDPTVAAQFIPLKEQYGRIAAASEAAEEGAARAARRGPVSLYDALAASSGHDTASGVGRLLLSKGVRTFGPSTGTWLAKSLANATEPLATMPDAVPALSSRVGAMLGPAETTDMAQVRALIEALRARAVPAELAQNQQ